MKTELLAKKFTKDEEVLAYLKNDYRSYRAYSVMRDEWKRKFIDFCTGKKTLPIMYDVFFKQIFNPDTHPGRLSSLLSSLIGEEVRIRKIFPLEDNYIEGGRMMVMDILVEMEDGSIANVEVQKIPYLFPGERISCYSSDIILRQYSKLRGEKGKDFKYKDLKKVYTVVIYEKTEGIFHKTPGEFIHHGRVKFDTGLELELLEEYCLIALDVFRQIPYHEEKRIVTGWLSFLTTESLEDAEQLIVDYPWLLEIYQEIASYRENPKEALMMFSDALRELDRNTMQYMIDEQMKQMEEQTEILNEQEEKINEQKERINEQAEKLNEQAERINEQAEKLNEQTEKLNEQKAELTEQKRLLKEKDEELDMQKKTNAMQEQEIIRLKKLLGEKQD